MALSTGSFAKLGFGGITGAGSGICLGCATELVRTGGSVILNDIVGNSLPRAAASIGKACDHSIGVSLLANNIFDEYNAAALVRDAIEMNEKIDILVTGPASTVRKPALELEPEDYLKVYNDNFVSHVYLAKLVAQDMIRRRSGGRIIFISSIYGDETITRIGSCPYDAAKAALNKATRVLAKEWAKYGILVNAIAPGFTDTPGERKLATDAEIAEVVGKLPLRRATTPKAIGEVAVMLASSDHITG